MSVPEHEIPFVPPWFVDAAALLAEPDPGPTPWLVENLIVDRALVAVVGRWKTTKSYGVLDLCIAIATGRPAFGVHAIPEPGPVVFINEESGKAALWRRLDALCRGRATNPEELRGRLLVAPNVGVKLDDEEWQDRLIRLYDSVQPRLIVFDPLARMKAPARNESAQNEMAGVIEFLRELREQAHAAVLFVHHTGHQGEHMRGSSDLESAWETRLRWKRDGQSPVVTIESEHREAEPAPPFEYRIAWDGLTRSMRFEAVEDPFLVFVRDYLATHPEASGNEVYKAAEGRDDRPHKSKVHKLVKSILEGGSGRRNHPGTTPPEAEAGSGSAEPPFRGVGTTPPADPLEVVPKPGTTRSNGRARIGDDGYLERMFVAFEAGHIVESEWRQADLAHRLVRQAAERAR
jgi:AAA domain